MRRKVLNVAGLADVIAYTNERMAEHQAQLKATGGLLGPGSAPYGTKMADVYAIGIPFREFTDEVPVVTAAAMGAVAESREDPFDTGHIAPKCMSPLNDWIEKNDADAQSRVIQRVSQLVYIGSKPAMTDKDGQERQAKGREAAAIERNFYPVSSEWCVSAEVANAFWEINSGFREIESWAYNKAGSGEWMPELQVHFNHWREFSHAWKTGHKRPTDLSGVTQDMQRCMDIVHEYGFPGAWHADKREQDYTKPTYGASRHVSAPSAEEQNDALKGAQAIKDNLEKATDPKSLWDLFNLLPWWGKAALGVAAAGIVGPPLASASIALSRLLSRKSGGRS